MIRIGLQWFFNQTGLAASSHLESGGFARTTDKVNFVLKFNVFKSFLD